MLVHATNGSNRCTFNLVDRISDTVASASLIVNASFTIVVISYKALHQKDMILNLVLTVSNLSSVDSVINAGEWPSGKAVLLCCYAIGSIGLFLTLDLCDLHSYDCINWWFPSGNLQWNLGSRSVPGVNKNIKFWSGLSLYQLCIRIKVLYHSSL